MVTPMGGMRYLKPEGSVSDLLSIEVNIFTSSVLDSLITMNLSDKKFIHNLCGTSIYFLLLFSLRGLVFAWESGLGSLR